MDMMKATMLTALLLFVAVAHISATRVCGHVYIWRNYNMTCPRQTNAVCADVYNVTIDWHHGTTCTEYRVLHQCMCSDNQVCPVTDDSHKIYESTIHTRFTCQPKCSLGWCDSSPDKYPLTKVSRAPEFGNRTYNQIDCLCPYHHSPVQTSYYKPATQEFGQVWDANRGSWLTYHTCRDGTKGTGNPCES
ncbi:hypothetical protein EGW08_022961 [Elysia chlorotica]|uniref:Uncharacterized protein n=1 Tax=Elysia chlorotica TaxID=188477 RepID=A0A433SJN4_ELYCH|nr:hypothetical protein EGW08_022961 [Elysia chlorotica]